MALRISHRPSALPAIFALFGLCILSSYKRFARVRFRIAGGYTAVLDLLR